MIVIKLTTKWKTENTYNVDENTIVLKDEEELSYLIIKLNRNVYNKKIIGYTYKEINLKANNVNKIFENMNGEEFKKFILYSIKEEKESVAK